MKGIAVRHLTSIDLEELEARLREDRAAVLDTIRTRLTGCDEPHHRELINSLAKGDRRAATALLSAGDSARLDGELAQLEAIDAALKRIDFGAGGLCIICGGPIPLARLRATPAALTCPDCQQRIEAAQARPGRPPA
jgi:RNA polymerase-binding transcription factor DksA